MSNKRLFTLLPALVRFSSAHRAAELPLIETAQSDARWAAPPCASEPGTVVPAPAFH